MSALQWIGKFPVVDALGWTLVHSLWQGLAVAVVVGIGLRAMRARSAQARYAVALGAMMLFPLAAVVTFGLLNRQAVPMPARAGDAAPMHLGTAVQMLPIAPVISPTTELPQTWDRKLRPMLPWLVLAWAGGVIVLGLYQLGGWIVVHRMRRTGETIDDTAAIATFGQLMDRLSISRPVRLARSALVQVPTVIGWLRPVVLLPMNALMGLTSDQLAGLLAHELAHVRRHDYLVNVVQTIVETLLFYHPAIWWLGSRIRQERENACDDLAAQICDRATYAQALAAMESLRQSPALALSARGGALLPRIRRILGLPDANPHRRFFSSLAGSLVVVAVVMSLFVFQACSSTKPTADSTTEPASTAITPDDLVAEPGDYRIGKNDLIQVTITDLQAVGVETVKQVRVSEDGKIRLPLIGGIDAAGKTEAELEKHIAERYRQAGVVANANVSATVIEARARTFSILGAVWQPGLYAIQKSDFRIFDALVLARGVNPSAKTLWVIRPIQGKPPAQSRKIEVPLEPLLEGDLRFNIVVRPDDVLIFRPQELATAPTPATRPIRADDLRAENTDHKLGPNDLISVSIYDLTAQGAETKREARVGESGTISMPLVGSISIAGKTIAEAEKAIAKAYEDAALLRNANVMITLKEDRSHLFSILFARGEAGNGGQYQIATSDFRLLDALAVAKANLAQIEQVKVRRDSAGQDNRLLEIPATALLSGDPQYNVIVRPKDTIIVQIRENAQSSTASPAAGATPNTRILQLQMELDQSLLALEAKKRNFGPNHPDVVALERHVVLLQNAIEQVKAASSTTQPSDNAAAHFVRIVIGTDRMTFEGKPVTWDNIRDELKNVPDRPNTALELAMGSEDVTIGQENKARGAASALVQEFGFKYLTLIGLHALGSKAGEAAPVTQRSARVAPVPGEYFMGGHVQRSGVYSITDRKITLRQAIWAAGGFDDSKMGDDTRIRILRRADGKEKILDFTWGDIAKPNNDPFLQPNDTIEVGTLPPVTQPSQ